jgi:hypothetical protein
MADDENRIQDFIFVRELAEVYLLLDNVSASADKSLNVPAAGAVPPPGAAGAAAGVDRVGPLPESLAQMLPPGGSRTMAAWIWAICNVGWPPTGDQMEQAAQATTLIMAKDYLNSLAAPATGATIAFTLLVADEDDGSGWSEAVRWVRERFGRADETPRPAQAMSDAGGGPPGAGAAGGGPPPRRRTWSEIAPSRTSLARLAYPGLIRRARWFAWSVRALLVFLALILTITCMLSWNVAIGNGIQTRLDTLERQRVDLDKLIADADTVSDKPASGAAIPPPVAVVGASGGGAVGDRRPAQPFVRYCERVTWVQLPGPPPQVREVFESAAQQRICDKDAVFRRDYAEASRDMAEWLHGWQVFWPLTDVPRLTDPAPADLNLQWAAVYLSVLGGGVLPIFYGFLGAGAAVTRWLSTRMKESRLSPRDYTLALIQLALGAVIGACIGLFATPQGAQPGSGLLSGVPLTASALCFIAGFGVEQVFVALQGLMIRVFGSGEAAKAR